MTVPTDTPSTDGAPEPEPIFNWDQTGNRTSYRPLPKGAHRGQHAPGWVWVSDGYYGAPAETAGRLYVLDRSGGTE